MLPLKANSSILNLSGQKKWYDNASDRDIMPYCTSLFVLVTNVAAQAHTFFLQVLLFKKVMSCMVFAKMHICFNANGAIRLILSN